LFIFISPFKNDADDALSFIATLVTLVIAMIGLLLKLDAESLPEDRNFDPIIMGNTLIGLTLFVIVATLLNMLFIKLGFWHYIETNVTSTVPTKSRRRRKRSSLSRRISLKIEQAVVHHKAGQVIEHAAIHKNKHAESLKRRMDTSANRLQERLKQRKLVNINKYQNQQQEKKQNKQKKQGAVRYWKTNFFFLNKRVEKVSDYAKDIEKFRILLKTKCKTKQRFAAIFSRIDNDNSNTLSKLEFQTLIKLLVKGNKKHEKKLKRCFDHLWISLCNNEVDVSLDRATAWLFAL
jgi:hypothetical protein